MGKSVKRQKKGKSFRGVPEMKGTVNQLCGVAKSNSETTTRYSKSDVLYPSLD